MTSSDSPAVSLPILRTPQDVHNFWFGESAKAGAGMDAMNDQVKFWFSSNFPEFSAVQQNNAALIDDVMNGNLDPAIWNSDEDPIALMAKVIILDQFTRSVHRGTARAFEGDLMAASLVKYAAGKGWYPLKFSAPERLFLCLNLYHTESSEHHELGRQLTEAFIEGVPEDTQKFLISIREGILNDHYLVIKQFGRYPHRNVLLVRTVFHFKFLSLYSRLCVTLP